MQAVLYSGLGPRALDLVRHLTKKRQVLAEAGIKIINLDHLLQSPGDIDDVFSSELATAKTASGVLLLCHRLYLQPDLGDVARIRNLLEKAVEKVHLVLTLPAQDRLMADFAGKYVFDGGGLDLLRGEAITLPAWFDHASTVEAWTGAFRPDQLVLLQDPESLQEGASVIENVVGQFGLPSAPRLGGTRMSAPAYDATAMELMRRINRIAEETADLDHRRDRAREIILKAQPAPKDRVAPEMPKAAAEALRNQYAEGNERICDIAGTSLFPPIISSAEPEQRWSSSLAVMLAGKLILSAPSKNQVPQIDESPSE